MTKEIELTKGMFALVDDDDYECMNKFKWAYSNGYAIRHISRLFYKRTIYMHAEIMHTPKGMETDHINFNTLDNRKENLRICTTSQNQANRGKSSNNTSGYKGVTWDKNKKSWRAQIEFQRKKIYLGNFKDPKDAASAYDDAALKYFGNCSNLNFPPF